MKNSIKINEVFTLRFNSRNHDTGDTLLECTVEFENPVDDSIVVHRLNTWLKAIGRDDLVVEYKEHKKGLA